MLEYTNSMNKVYFIQLSLFIFQYSYLCVALCCDDVSLLTVSAVTYVKCTACVGSEILQTLFPVSVTRMLTCSGTSYLCALKPHIK